MRGDLRDREVGRGATKDVALARGRDVTWPKMRLQRVHALLASNDYPEGRVQYS